MSAAVAGRGRAYEGASANRLQGGWLGQETDPNWDWLNDATELAARAGDSVRNDTICAALLNAKTMGEQGSRGLKFRSLVELDKKVSTSQAESDLRQQIEREIEDASSARNLDASGIATRREMETGLSELSATTGEAFAIRCWIPGRPGAHGATCWRTIRRDRVCNKPGVPDSDRLYQGMVLSPYGAPIAIWVGPPQRAGAYNLNPADWTLVPIYDENGVQAVIHRIGRRAPGAYRGISMFAPILYLAKQVKALIDAYVVAKRVQACHPIFIKCSDPNAAAKKDRNGAVWGPNTTLEPGKVYYVGEDAALFFPTWAFNGQDMQAFLDTLYRNQFASWGLPIDVVLAQLGKTNMAASRSAWLQFYRMAEKWQDDHIEQCSLIIDTSIIQEAVLAGRIVMPAGMTLKQLMRGRYIRPPRSMPDPLKEAQAVEKWTALGRDRTGLWGESGVDFSDSVQQREEDDRRMSDAGVGDNPSAASTQQKDSEFIDRVAAASAKIDKVGVAGLEWPMVVAASAAVSAPSAFIAATVGLPDPTTPDGANPPDDDEEPETTPDDAPPPDEEPLKDAA